MGRQARGREMDVTPSLVNGCHFGWGVEGSVPCNRWMFDDGRSKHASLNRPDIVYVSRP